MLLAAACLFVLAGDGPAATATFTLKPKVGDSPKERPVDVEDSKVVFTKEPDFGKADVLRGRIPVGIGGTSSVAFAVDMSAQKLYLDRNGNLDLTDDPSGVVKGEGSRHYLTFSAVIDVPVGGTSLPYRVRMSAYKQGTSQHCTVGTASYWEGEVELAGEKWRLAVADDLDGVIGIGDSFVLVRSSTNKESEARMWECGRVHGATNLSVNGCAYNLSFSFRPAEEDRLAVTVTPVSNLATRALELEGESISRLTLYATMPVILDRPGRGAVVPKGVLGIGETIVSEGRSPGVRYRAGSSPWERGVDEGPVTIEDGDGPVRLRVGGPLSNTVALTRHGSTLYLRYEVRGIDGRKYECIGGLRDRKPSFVVRQNGKEVARGDFEYG